MLLARLGVGQIVLIDNDIVDRTNLNRLHGAFIRSALQTTRCVNARLRMRGDLTQIWHKPARNESENGGFLRVFAEGFL